MEAFYIEVSAEVRYWDDAIINGVRDTEGNLIPHRKDKLWCPVIRLSDGFVLDWPEGTTANVCFKVCDQGEYWLLDENRNRIAKWSDDYVPNRFLCPGDEGYGDYIILMIGADGMVEKWEPPKIYTVRKYNGNKLGWKAIS